MVAIAHNNVMGIDGTVVITGSFNFTKAAQDRNAENLRVLEDPALVVEYRANWEDHGNRRPHARAAPGGDGRGGVPGTDRAASSGVRFDLRRGMDAFEAADQTGTAFSELRSQTDPTYKPAVKESLGKLPTSIAQPIQQ